MDTTRPKAPPPILDMTPDGAFRDPMRAAAPGGTWLDRALARIGGAALLLALAAGGVVLVAFALVFVGLLLPIVIGAGLIAFASLWWRMRRLRAQGGDGAGGPGVPPAPGLRVFVIRR
jgi:hypothetical protein